MTIKRNDSSSCSGSISTTDAAQHTCARRQPRKLLGSFITTCIRIYRYLISPISGPVCRYYPSCSEYSLQAIQSHGVRKGLYLSLCRLSRCHPWGGHGYDPVPPSLQIKIRNCSRSSH